MMYIFFTYIIKKQIDRKKMYTYTYTHSHCYPGHFDFEPSLKLRRRFSCMVRLQHQIANDHHQRKLRTSKWWPSTTMSLVRSARLKSLARSGERC